MTKRRARPKPKPKTQPGLDRLLTGEVVGGALVVAAILLGLSMLSTNRGSFTGAAIDKLQIGFGVGTWVLPLLLGAFGAWLALREVTDQRALSARRLAGGLGLFMVALATAHILADAPDPRRLAYDGAGGGLAGWFFSQGLITAFGLVVAVGVLVVIAALSAYALIDVPFGQLRDRARALWQQVKGKLRGPDGRVITPPLPFGHSDPLPKRLWRRLAGLWPPRRPPRAIPSQPPWARPQVEPQTSRPTPSPSRPPTTTPAAAANLQPRIVGGRGPTAWHLPVIAEILEDATEVDIQGEDLRRRARTIETTLESFGIPVQVVEANQGPAVTQFGLRPGIIVRRDRKGEEKRIKVRVAQIQALANDLSLALAASPIRIEAPVPGRDIVGVEVPNVQISTVALRGVMDSEEFRAMKGPLAIGLGRDVSGQSAVADLSRMPHLLIAGATGSGKSVCVNAIITALLLTHTPDTLRFLMIDPKRVELTMYNGIPHLIAPVIVEVERAVPVLQWCTREMERRYKLFAKAEARNIESYNEKLAARGEQILPYIVILIDELADLMLSAPEDAERYVCRIAQMARATGIHLVIATQRPSVDVVTGLIKANFPARIGFAVASLVDSRVILDTPGAEQLLGRGDMLYMAPDSSKLLRLQGCMVSDRETQRLVRYWQGARSIARQEGAKELPDIDGGPAEATVDEGAAPARQGPSVGLGGPGADLEPPWLPGQEMLQQPLWDQITDAEAGGANRDELYEQAVAEVQKSGRASVSLLQRRLRVGYSRAARLIDQMETDGIVGPDLGGSRGREVLPQASAAGAQGRSPRD